MAKLIIDGNEIEVPDHYTLLQACEEGGADHAFTWSHLPHVKLWQSRRCG